MADNGEGEETTSRGNEWEVVSLTASAYAAAPNPEQVELNDNGKESMAENNEGETSRAMFMSSHFVFPPSQHENLPLEPENIEIHSIQGIEDDGAKLGSEEEGISDTKDEQNWGINKGLAMADDFPGIQFFDEKVSLSIHGTELDKETALQRLNLLEKEQSMYSAPKFSAFSNETPMDESAAYDENKIIPGQIEPSEGGLDSDISKLPKPAKEDTRDSSELPCGAWWKRQAASLYAQAKEANAFWSIFVAAAVMGLVILGQRWQQERWRTLQLNWQISTNDEMGRILGPISRFKEVFVGGNRRGSFIRGSSSTDR
ncbi:ATG8-interacting protein 1-like isoform X2 [Diospyros lotus]|uniref:ATG8-interacting protein 1-like isoform X2 n=1 Tax=Diospyros lotus TaxID=55363 RepID=UPI00224DE958|nr:ATG8-interacting protein 1-like isoform X2 [Diospyros lotus]